MASSWLTIPHLQPSSDIASPKPHPGELAHERTGPFAVSAAQICVKLGEDGQPSLPSDLVLDKRYTHNSSPAVVTLQVKDGPPAPSRDDVHANVFTASPFPKQKPVARQQSTSSSSTFERQVFASVPATNSHPIAPISAASDSTPPLPHGSPDARPISTTDISTAASPTAGYSVNQSVLTQSPNLGRIQPGRPTPGRSGTSRTFGTSAGASIAQTEYTDMLFEAIPFRFNVMTCFFSWIILAGFLVLPTSFPDIQTILADSNKLSKVVRVARNVPLLAIGFTCCGIGATGLCYLWWCFKHNYVWLLSSIFIPGLFNGLAGVISTFVNLYGSGNGVHYATPTIATIAATGGYAAICGLLTAIYTIKRHFVKRRHDHISREMNGSGDVLKDKLQP